MYTIYHIPGVKVGCSKRVEGRVKEQGYTNYEVLEVHEDRQIASQRERELQIEYGYEVDTNTYEKMQRVLSNPVVRAAALVKLRDAMKKPEVRAKISENMSRPKSEQWKVVASKNRKNKRREPHSEERKQNISKACIGRISGNKGKVRVSTYVACQHCSKNITIQNLKRHENKCK